MACPKTPNLRPENGNMYCQAHAFTASTSNLPGYTPRPARLGQQLRQDYSRGIVLDRPRRDVASSVASPFTRSALEELDPNPIFSYSPLTAQPLEVPKPTPTASSTSSSSTVSYISTLKAEDKQRKAARKLFEQHGIRRPPGWFSDEDLSLSGDRTASPRRFCRICHVCSARTWSQTYCSSCKHRLCARCLCEVPKSTERAHTGFSHHPGHTFKLDEGQLTQQTSSIREPKRIVQKKSQLDTANTSPPSHAHRRRDGDPKSQLNNLDNEKLAQEHPTTTLTNPLSEQRDSSRGFSSRSVKQNPFVVADKATESEVESHVIEQSTIQPSQGQRSSQRCTNDSDHEIPCIKVECDDPICRATHDGHYPYRHSITCALHRSEEAEKTRASSKELSTSENASVVRPLKPQSNEDAPPASNYASYRHRSIDFHDPYYVTEHLTSRMGHGFHELYTQHEERSLNETRMPALPSGLVAKPRVPSFSPRASPTPVAPSTQVSRLRSVEEVVPPDHHEHERHLLSVRNAKSHPIRPPLKANPLAESGGRTMFDQTVRSAGSTKPSTATRQEDEESGNLKHSHGEYATTGHSHEYKLIETERIFCHDWSCKEGHVVKEREAPSRKFSPAITEEIVDNAQTKRPIPKSHVLSPPPWLKSPSKEAGDPRSRLRHVDTKSHGHLLGSRAMNSGNTEVERRTSSIPRPEFVRSSFNELTTSKYDFLRISAPSPPTALHVTQHQRPEPWLDHSSDHMPSRASHELSIRTIGTSPVSPRDVSPRGDQKMLHHHERPAYFEDIGHSSRGGFLSPSSARSGVLRPHQSPNQSNLAYSSVPREPWNETYHPEAQPSSFRVSTRTASEYNDSAPRTISRVSHSPLQPRQILLDVDEGAGSENHASAREIGNKEPIPIPSESLDYEIQRPNPVAPPNHHCGWEERYLALTAEIRLLKAELSTRASLRGTDIDYTVQGEEGILNEDDDLGIQGVTIVMHLKGRDDLVINTDLT
ncbi:hypothetical protein F4677DRAFT_460162 [Hypoxylon crocopeplum]|nr:hypothetical protein F4677DRAFT_460162 [Hypoxylon crocopeplum]